MYKIYAGSTLIYDSTIDDYKIDKGQITLEVNKSGSFKFSLYPDHPYYDKFVRMKTVITVYKSGKIVFRGRVLNDVTDYWNNKVLTCEGEMGFLQDSIIRPFSFEGTPAELFQKFIADHNAQVDDFKKFKIGRITVVDPNNYIVRSNEAYESTFNNLSDRLLTDSLGGYIYITHGEDGTDPRPTINYLADFDHVSTQSIEFGSNLKDYTKTESAENIVTAIIPLGAEIDDGDDTTEPKRLTIESVNDGKDYVYHEGGVALYGWITKAVEWDDVTLPENLKSKAEEFLESSVNHNITVELNAIDLHLLDKSIESFKVGDYVRVISEPHNIATTLLCQQQTIDLLKPDNDTITLGHTYSTFTSSTSSAVDEIKSNVTRLGKKTNSYKVAEQKLTSLMAQSFGVFRTTEKLPDGSEIYYLHDKRSLEESTTIWKMTENAFAVSTDGGQTWNAGLDADGNAVVNVLSTIGIEADWIDVEDLSAIGATIGGWKIDKENIHKVINLYEDMSATGLANVGDDDPVRYWTWMRSPSSPTTPVFGIYYMKKSDYLNGNNVVYQIFSAKADGSVVANSLKSNNINITGGTISLKGLATDWYPIQLESVDGNIIKVGPNGAICVNKNQGTYAMLAKGSLETGYCTVDGDYISRDERGAIGHTGVIRSQYTYDEVTSSYPNVYINEGGVLKRSSSSSERYKDHITEDIPDNLDPKRLYNIPVKSFRYKDGYLSEGDAKEGRDILGFIVEDFVGKYDEAIQYDSDGRPEMWNAQIMIPALLKLVQEQNDRISMLEKKIGDKVQ